MSLLYHKNENTELSRWSSFITLDFSENHCVLVFDLSSMQNATENWFYPKKLGEPLRLELNFTDPLENVTEIIVLG